MGCNYCASVPVQCLHRTLLSYCKMVLLVSQSQDVQNNREPVLKASKFVPSSHGQAGNGRKRTYGGGSNSRFLCHPPFYVQNQDYRNELGFADVLVTMVDIRYRTASPAINAAGMVTATASTSKSSQRTGERRAQMVHNYLRCKKNNHMLKKYASCARRMRVGGEVTN